MEAGTGGEGPAALRPLRTVEEPLRALAAGPMERVELRRAVLQVADAVEASLRRLLRDTDAVPVEVRLRALAPDEMRPDEVLAELRRGSRISMDLGAAVHELFEARRRLGSGSAPGPADAGLALRTVDGLRREAAAPPAVSPASPASFSAPPPPVDANPPAPDETLVHTVRPRAVGGEGARRPLVLGAMAALLLLVVGGFWLANRRDDAGLAQGMALFRSGAYADAASFFWRYAEENPRDATPHLYLARIHRRMSRPDLATQELSTALELAPEDPGVHAELGFLLLDTGRAELAVERFRIALRYDPDTAEAWIGLVRALQVQGRADAAERVLARAPERVRDLFARGAPPQTP